MTIFRPIMWPGGWKALIGQGRITCSCLDLKVSHSHGLGRVGEEWFAENWVHNGRTNGGRANTTYMPVDTTPRGSVNLVESGWGSELLYLFAPV